VSYEFACGSNLVADEKTVFGSYPGVGTYGIARHSVVQVNEVLCCSAIDVVPDDYYNSSRTTDRAGIKALGKRRSHESMP
jgi:hypothetical protein